MLLEVEAIQQFEYHVFQTVIKMNVRNDFGKLFIYLFIASSIPRVGDTSISATARSISKSSNTSADDSSLSIGVMRNLASNPHFK